MWRLSAGLPNFPPPGTFTVGFVRALKPWPGPPALLEAFSMLREMHPGTRLRIVRDGPERERTVADLAARGLLTPLQDLRVHGGGLRVVASRVGQLAALIEDGYNSFCAPGDPPSLAVALLQLDRAPELRARLGRAARATVLRYHTWDAVVRRILSANLKPVTERRSVLVDA